MVVLETHVASFYPFYFVKTFGLIYDDMLKICVNILYIELHLLLLFCVFFVFTFPPSR